MAKSFSINSYSDADQLLQGRNHQSRKIGNNTYLVRYTDWGNIAVRLHATDIVTYYPDGRIVLNTGGWKTVTTKSRINEFSPLQISQAKGVWSIRNYAVAPDEWVSYADGITWDSKTRKFTNLEAA